MYQKTIKLNDRLIVLISFLLFSMQVFTQENKTKTVVNQYIDYINHCNLYISATHFSVKNYNLKILKNFNKPAYFYANEDYFKLSCYPGSYQCTERLNTVALENEYILLVKNSNLIGNNDLLIAVNKLHQNFNELISVIEVFDNKKYSKAYFLDTQNIKNFEKDLENYKNKIEILNSIIQKATILAAQIFNEKPLPKPLERTKKLCFLLKKSIENFKKKDTALVKRQLVEIQQLINEKDYGTDLQAMQTFGDFNYIDNLQIQERANIERYAQNQVNTINKMLTDNPRNYGVRTYEKIENVEKHKQIFKIERSVIFFNDNTGQSVVANYNKYIHRSKQPILHITGIVLPFEIITFSKFLEQKNIDTETTQTNTLEISKAAKINNLVLLLDISSSMKNDNKMVNLKIAITHLIDLLRENDLLTVIIYSTSNRLLFNSLDDKQTKFELKKSIQNIKPNGSTNIKDALDKAYEFCQKNYISNGNNRIIIATDGFFKLNKSGRQLIKKNEKISLSTFHFKSKDANNNEEKVLQKMAKLGSGSYVLINDLEDVLQAIVIEASQK